MTGVSIGAGTMTRIWLDAGASNRSVCTSVLAAGGGLSTAAESTFSRSSVAAIVAGGAVFAVEVVEAGVVGRGAAVGAGSVLFGCELQHGFEVARSSVAAGSALGQATREFILSARRARPMGLRVRSRNRPSFRFRPRYFCCCLVLGADVARFRMHRLVVLMRRMQSREIGFAGLVCGGCALRGRGTGNKPGHRGG